MELKEAQEELRICEIQDKLTEEQRNKKRIIFSTAKRKLDGDAEYKRYREDVINTAEDLEEKTNGAFVLDSSIQVNKYKLKQLITKYGERQECRDIINVATDLYKKIELLSATERQTILAIVDNLSILFNRPLLGKNAHERIVEHGEDAVQVYDEMKIDEYHNERLRALADIEAMFGDLGIVAAQYTHELVDTVFSYYIYGGKEIYGNEKNILEPQPEMKQK